MPDAADRIAARIFQNDLVSGRYDKVDRAARIIREEVKGLLDCIEMAGAERAYAAGLGAGEWEACLADRERAELAKWRGGA